MSYKNTSIPLRPGLNLIIGPNGAGKSSILLGISVVLGQAYTERAKKLSELIRWNEQEARISLLLDNEAPKGARPFPQARSDKVLITRVLKRSGDYHYLLNNKPVSKTALVEGLSRIGLNPDNMLVIMHQLMVGRFGSVSPIDKLLLLEDAVGFGAYRREVLEASSRLQKLTTERETMSSVLEGTKEHLKLEHGRGLRAGALEWIARVTKLLRSQQDVLTGIQERAHDVSLAKENDQLGRLLSDLIAEQEKISSMGKTADQDFEKVRIGIAELASQVGKNTDLLIESRVKKEVSNFKLALMEQEIQDLEVQLRIGQEEIEPLRTQASQLGPVFESPRDLQQISLDVASVQERLRPLAHLSAEVQKMYKNYGELYEGLRKKAEVVEQNRSEVLGELRERFDRWKTVMDKLLEELSTK